MQAQTVDGVTVGKKAATGSPQSIPLAPEIRPRNPALQIDGEIPRHWLANNVVATALGNAVNVLFPAGERFFIRSVRHFQDDPRVSTELRAQIQGFFGQEGRHAQQHERMNRLIVEQGIDLRRFLRIYEALAYGVLERLMPATLRLSATAAAEHFTATMAHNFLSQTALIERLHPQMRALLLWHAAEEIEHKAVAFDVLGAVDGRYELRVAGLCLASLLLGGFWAAGTVSVLVRESRTLGWKRIWQEAKTLGQWRKQTGRKGIVREVFATGIKEYLARDFHPNQTDDYPLAQAYLSSVGLA